MTTNNNDKASLLSQISSAAASGKLANKDDVLAKAKKALHQNDA
jgi:hypothetical protein